MPSVPHSTGPAHLTECFKCRRIGHYKANCPQAFGARAGPMPAHVMPNQQPDLNQMVKSLANALMTTLGFLAVLQPTSSIKPTTTASGNATEAERLINELTAVNRRQTEQIARLEEQVRMLTLQVTVLQKSVVPMPQLATPLPSELAVASKFPGSPSENQADPVKPVVCAFKCSETVVEEKVGTKPPERSGGAAQAPDRRSKELNQ